MVTVVIPCYNERYHIGEVLSRLKKMRKKYEIIVVDDGSKDGTANVVRQFGFEPIVTRHYGKAHACMIGAKHARSELIVFIDGDGQLYPEDIPKIVKALRSADLVLGQRNFKKMPWQRRFSNHFASRMLKIITGKRFKDVLCGLRGIRKSKMQIRYDERGYEFEIDTIIEAMEKNLRIKTVPVRVSYHVGSRMPKRKSILLFLNIVLKVMKSLISKRAKRMKEVKQVIIVRNDLKMGKGKIAAQVAHASLESAEKVGKRILNEWKSQGHKKVVLKIDSLEELKKIKKKCDKLKIKNALIKDAGRTQLKPGTVTCLGIGPDYSSKIDKITGKLKLLE